MNQKSTAGYGVTVSALTALAVFVNTLALYVSIFATDSCGPARPALRCTGAGLLTLWALPWAGLAAALLCCFGLGLRAARRGATPWPFLPAGALLYAASLAVAWLVMTA
ncbi:hypothetical protein LG634_30120 [Streptomyces bambusae]|uniref:hypothetical protein n=1 Tax=Streptomyces bambusae TaxID=1550616 RepID=UPI001CFED405|nr:hypothetical protein [Streptomyces bambusae]MCB5169056.1 hypothetical protein [Streptomyces bambusae]